MKTRKNNKKRKVGGEVMFNEMKIETSNNSWVNNINTRSRLRPTTYSSLPTPAPPKQPRGKTKNPQTLKNILTVTRRNVNKNGNPIDKNVLIYDVALKQIEWIMDSLPIFGSKDYKDIMNRIRKDIEKIKEESERPLNNVIEYNVNSIIDIIDRLLYMLDHLNKMTQSIMDKKLGTNLQKRNKYTLYKIVGEDIVRMYAFSIAYTPYFKDMRKKLVSRG